MKAIFVAGTFLLMFSQSFAIDIEQANVRSFIDEMVRDHEFDRADLVETLKKAEMKQNIIDAISRPAEKTLTWAEYRKIFITPERIAAGAEFCREHADMLNDVAETSGVPVEILVGIIGVETYYGRITGGYRVLDALSTLAFHYPPRSKFFRKELAQYLLLVREESLSAEEPTGSYAGAMGRPQFMPSSYRAYAIDSTGDGKRDIWNDWADVAGSVANYFNAHGWRSGEPVVVQATLGGQWRGPTPSPKNTLSASQTVAKLSKKGVLFATDMADDAKAELLTFEAEDGMERWIGFHNFFVITRYNRSAMYALAVHQLGQEVALAVKADEG